MCSKGLALLRWTKADTFETLGSSRWWLVPSWRAWSMPRGGRLKWSASRPLVAVGGALRLGYLWFVLRALKTTWRVETFLKKNQTTFNRYKGCTLDLTKSWSIIGCSTSVRCSWTDFGVLFLVLGGPRVPNWRGFSFNDCLKAPCAEQQPKPTKHHHQQQHLMVVVIMIAYHHNHHHHQHHSPKDKPEKQICQRHQTSKPKPSPRILHSFWVFMFPFTKPGFSRYPSPYPNIRSPTFFRAVMADACGVNAGDELPAGEVVMIGAGGEGWCFLNPSQALKTWRTRPKRRPC